MEKQRRSETERLAAPQGAQPGQHIAADMYGGAAAHQDHAAYAQHHQQSMAAHGRDSEADVAKEDSGAHAGRSALQNKLAAANAGTHNRLSGPRSMGRPPVPHWR